MEIKSQAAGVKFWKDNGGACGKLNDPAEGKGFDGKFGRRARTLIKPAGS
jgi:hypothetical protein